MQGKGNAADQHDGGHPLGLRRAVTSATGATFAIFIADRLVQVAFLAVLARLLQPAEFAVAAAASLFVSLVVLASHMGIGAAIVQRAELSERSVLTARTLVMAAAVVLLVVAELAAPLIGAWFRNPQVTDAVRVLAPLCLIQALAFAPHALLIRRLKARGLTFIDLFSGIVGQGLVAIPLALMGWSYWALIAGTLVQALTRLAATMAMQRLPAALAFNLDDARQLWSRGVGFSLTVFLQRAAAESDRIIVGRYLGAVDLGLYARANGLMAFPAAIYGAVADRVAFPAFAQVQAEPARMGPAYAQAMALTALIGAPITVLLVILGPEVIRFLLGPNWVGAIEPFKVLAVAIYFRMADRINGTLLRGGGRPYLMAGIQAAVSTLMVLGCLWAARDSITAVAGVAVAASLMSYLLLTAAASRVARLGLREVLAAHLPAVAAALLVACVAGAVTWAAREAGWASFPTLAAAGFATLAAGLGAIVVAPGLFLGPAGNEALSVLRAMVRERRAAIS